MKFGPVVPADALGATAVHSIRQGDLVLRKGTLIGPAEVAALKAAGIKEIVVARLEPGDVEVWVASHASASTNGLPSVGGTNGAISNIGLTIAEPAPGHATERAVLTITGDVYEPSVTDQKLVVATVS